jgi:cellulose synthase/poly-beta-1,6-N-acetylglucosamine synthase-like glycosyltransferase
VTILAVVALGLVAIAWVGYPVVATLLSWLRRRSGSSRDPTVRRVSVVVATRDAPAVVAARVDDLLSTAYPQDLLEIVVAVDVGGPYDHSDYVALLPRTVRLVVGDPPGGKAVTLNAGVRAATSTIVVFADSAQRFDPDAIPTLMGFLATHAECGAVSGAYRTRPAAVAWPLRAFWALETQIRRAEARLGGLVAVTGAIYAIRRALWRPLPPGLICDDLYVPLHMAARGFRVGFCEAARASDPRTFDSGQEFSRKVRTLTGLLQVCRWCPWVLVPWRNPVWLQFVCHKLLRLATPYLLLVACIGLAPAWPSRAPDLWPAGAALALLAVAAIARPTATRRVLSRATSVIWLQAAPIVATLNAIRGRWDVWQHAAPAGANASVTAV